MRANDAISPDDRPVHHGSAHAHYRVLSNLAAMNNRPVADGSVLSNNRRMTSGNMDNRSLLDVRLIFHRDRR